jgi:Uma2 family endonuclease
MTTFKILMPKAAARMTAEEFLALPVDESVRQWLVKGELRTAKRCFHSRFHAAAMANLTARLSTWLQSKNQLDGYILCDQVTMQFDVTVDTILFADIAFVSKEMFDSPGQVMQGVPTLVVEIWDYDDVRGHECEKLRAYRKAGVPLIWFVDPDEETVTIYRLAAKPTLVNASQILTGEDVLPGFSVPVADLFN